MSAFHYRGDDLWVDEVRISDIAERVRTPFYVYAEKEFVSVYQAYSEALKPVQGEVFYALKANSNQAIICRLGKEGAGMDTVSAGEIKRALAAGVPAKKIIFSGVGKTDEELAFATDLSIYQINVETRGELKRLNRIALSKGKRATIALRVNLDYGAGGHSKTITGKSDNKFGISHEDIPALISSLSSYEGIALKGLAAHIGSQILNLDDFRESALRLKALWVSLKEAGFHLPRLDLGGGLGITYHEDHQSGAPALLGKLYCELFADCDVKIAIEPGRSIIGNAGGLVTSVVEKQYRTKKRFIIVDAAMNDLIRPTLYDGYHDIMAARKREQAEGLFDVVGPVCESGDYLAQNRTLVEPEPDDLLVLKSAGAYGAVMASTYNSRPLVPELLVLGSSVAVIRERKPIETLIGDDSLPPWMAP